MMNKRAYPYLLLLCLLLGSAQLADAQRFRGRMLPSVYMGDTFFKIGTGYSDIGIPVFFGLEHGIRDNLTIGAEFSIRKHTDTADYNFSIIMLMGRVDLHFNTLFQSLRKFDPYVGLSAGISGWNVPDDYPYEKPSGAEYFAQLGFRYFFNRHYGLHAEGFYGSFSGGRIGFSYKF